MVQAKKPAVDFNPKSTIRATERVHRQESSMPRTGYSVAGALCADDDFEDDAVLRPKKRSLTDLLTDPPSTVKRGKQSRHRGASEARPTAKQANAGVCSFCEQKGHNRQSCKLYESFGIDITNPGHMGHEAFISGHVESLQVIEAEGISCIHPAEKDCKYAVIIGRPQSSTIGVDRLLHVRFSASPILPTIDSYVTVRILAKLMADGRLKGVFIHRPTLL
jgi:hypothetical protein